MDTWISTDSAQLSSSSRLNWRTSSSIAVTHLTSKCSTRFLLSSLQSVTFEVSKRASLICEAITHHELRCKTAKVWPSNFRTHLRLWWLHAVSVSLKKYCNAFWHFESLHLRTTDMLPEPRNSPSTVSIKSRIFTLKSLQHHSVEPDITLYYLIYINLYY